LGSVVQNRLSCAKRRSTTASLLYSRCSVSARPEKIARRNFDLLIIRNIKCEKHELTAITTRTSRPKMSASAAAASPSLRFSSTTYRLAPLHRPLSQRLRSVQCSLAAVPGVWAPPELVESILSKVTLTSFNLSLFNPFQIPNCRSDSTVIVLCFFNERQQSKYGKRSPRALVKYLAFV
jgi:hypothetical protein